MLHLVGWYLTSWQPLPLNEFMFHHGGKWVAQVGRGLGGHPGFRLTAPAAAMGAGKREPQPPWGERSQAVGAGGPCWEGPLASLSSLARQGLSGHLYSSRPGESTLFSTFFTTGHMR